MSFEVKNFEEEVIKRSHQVPVLVDFWAPWCGPCQVLGSTIEKLANEAEGKWELIKVNVDEHKELSTNYKVKGIPAVKLFSDGELIGEFSGALPEAHIQQWLATFLPTPDDKEARKAVALLENGDSDGAKAKFEEILANNPEHDKSVYFLGKMLIFEDTERSKELLKIAAKYPVFLGTINDLLGLIDILELKNNPASLEDGKVKEQLLEAVEALCTEDFDTALEKLINTIIVNKAYHHEIARKACIAIFIYLGPQHQTTKKYRKRFDMALY